MALIKCSECGKEISDTAAVCVNCGAPIKKENTMQSSGVSCPKCGSNNVDSQVFQENTGSATVTRTKSKYKQTGHGCLWWLLIGWWWWIVDLLLWMFFFVPRLLIQIFKKKKYKGESISTTVTSNELRYKTMFICKNCGEHWEK